MIDINRTMAEMQKDLVTLKHTNKITEDDLVLPKWYWLSEQYKKTEKTEGKVAVSIFNSIIHQQRIVFVMSRNSIRELVKGDKNWNGKAGFKNESWSSILALLYRLGLKELQRGVGSAPSIYEVTAPDILNFLQVDVKKQRQEAIDFVQNMHEVNAEIEAWKNSDCPPPN